jgi:hypothetical protein
VKTKLIQLGVEFGKFKKPLFFLDTEQKCTGTQRRNLKATVIREKTA